VIPEPASFAPLRHHEEQPGRMCEHAHLVWRVRAGGERHAASPDAARLELSWPCAVFP
jgi:hypothetical protein